MTASARARLVFGGVRVDGVLRARPVFGGVRVDGVCESRNIFQHLNFLDATPFRLYF